MLVRAVLIALALAASGCSAVLGLDDLVADRTCTGQCGEPGCGACPSGPMVEVDSPSGPYRIDAYEVTNADYQAFLAAAPTVDRQPPCAWNDTYVAGELSQQAIDDAAMAMAALEDDPLCTDWLDSELAIVGGLRPVACIDWCDAAAYCAWAGKRLCGKLGGGELDLTNDVTPLTDAGASEWYRACSPSALDYPYGATYVQGACNDSNTHNEEVGKRTECEGGVPGLFDMSGNVEEWSNACTHYQAADSQQNCARPGGAFWNSALELMCVSHREAARATQGASTGFRCCG